MAKTAETMSFPPNVADQLHLLASGTRACPSRRSARSAPRRTGVSWRLSEIDGTRQEEGERVKKSGHGA